MTDATDATSLVPDSTVYVLPTFTEGRYVVMFRSAAGRDFQCRMRDYSKEEVNDVARSEARQMRSQGVEVNKVVIL